jgi:peptide subunit release factor 1 (eRF1)
MFNTSGIVSLPKSEWDDIIKRRIEIDCPHCAETIEYFPKAFNFKGNIKCPKCGKLFWVEIEQSEVINISTQKRDNNH